MAFKFGGKEMHLIFAFAKCCWSIDSSGMAWQACAQQTEPLPQTLQLHVKLM